MAAESVIKEVADEVVEEIVETTSTLGGKVALVAGGIVIGAAVGYVIADRRLKTKYEKIAEDEIEEMRAYYKRSYAEPDVKQDGLEDPQDGPDEKKKPELTKPELEKVMGDLGYSTKMEGPDEVVYVKVEPEGDWDYDLEKSMRSEDHPYIIHKDEYFGNEMPFEQITLTYYEGDDILADSHDTPVDDQDAMVGLGALSRFGHGSGDPNVVYVRNHELELEIEIIHSDGKFKKEVHGIDDDDELQHSNKRRKNPRKFDDDQT